MNLIDLLAYISDEEKAEKYLREIKILYTYEKCIYCSSSLLGYVRRGKIKCYKCKREWSRRKGSMIENNRLTFTQFVVLLKLYSLKVPTKTISNELNLSNALVNKIINEVRIKITKNGFSKLLEKINANIMGNNRIVIYMDINKKLHLDFAIKNKQPQQLNSTVYIGIDISRRKDETGKYYYQMRAFGVNTHLRLDYQLIGIWKEMKLEIEKYNHRNQKYLYYYLCEIVYKFNHRENIFVKICENIRVAEINT